MESILNNTAQEGVAYGLLVLIIIVLARRVIYLEKKVDKLTDEKFDIYKEVLTISNNAIKSLKSVSKILGDDV